MENKHKYLWILTAISLSWGTVIFNSYADDRDDDERVVKIVKEKEVTISKDKRKKAKKNRERRDEVKEVISGRTLNRIKSEEVKFYGEVAFEGAHSIGAAYPVKTNFTPSLIKIKKDNKKLMNIFKLEASLKAGVNKKFMLEGNVLNGTLEFTADPEEVKLSQVFVEWEEWAVGIKENNFCNIAATCSPAKVMQVSWKKNINPMLNIGASIEQGKNFEFLSTERIKANEKAEDLSPRRDLPAASARLQYNIPDKLGEIELSGLLRPMGWHHDKTKKDVLQLGWGLNIGAKLNLRPEINILVANIVWGNGIGDYTHDLGKLQEVEMSSIYLKTDSKTAQTIMAAGLDVTFEHRWTPSLRSTLGGGINTIWGEDKTARPEAYKLGAYLSGNVMYWFTEKTSAGVEYATGLRQNLATTSNQNYAGAHHLKAMLIFKI